ncbi:Cytochrome P450 72C1 [Acorus calamus]|uniref:Cytochrome P450 72C1 n=1 Tax=Acorus calamus TaxID=4465 RepID=A0AAV9EM20_ACOCL|nr:Cytochrome P450 72C1 [Acorus calamus]
MGPCKWIGQGYAMMEAKLALVMMLQNFSFELSPTYSHSPQTIIALQPQHGAQVLLFDRNLMDPTLLRSNILPLSWFKQRSSRLFRRWAPEPPHVIQEPFQVRAEGPTQDAPSP